MNESLLKELVELSPELGGCAMSAIDIEVMIGASLGAWLIMSSKRNAGISQRVTTFFLSAGAGYLFAPMAMQIAPVFTAGGAAFGCALIVVPISIKVHVWIKQADLPELIKRLRGGAVKHVVYPSQARCYFLLAKLSDSTARRRQVCTGNAVVAGRHLY